MLNSNLQLADVFRAGFKNYCRQSPARLPKQHYDVANAIMACHSAALGGHVYTCGACGHEKISYNSCRNRHCPSCQAQARAQWVDKRLEELLDVSYFHAVFTIPNSLNAFALRNKKAFYALFFKAVSQTLIELGYDTKRLGAQLGFIAVLHTWGQNLMDHPHIHCIVPAGGLRSDDQWVHAPCKNFLFPVDVLAALFRGKFMHFFRNALKNGDILLHGTLAKYSDDPSLLKTLIDTLYRTDWIVYVKPPFAGPAAVIKYLGRYTHRIAIANSRLLSVDDTHVSFRWKDYRDGNAEKIMTLPIGEFLRRFLLHVVPKGFVRIRYYGFLSCRARAVKLPMCKSLTATHTRSGDQQNRLRIQTCLWRCPMCGKGIMVRMRSINIPDPGGTLAQAA